MASINISSCNAKEDGKYENMQVNPQQRLQLILFMKLPIKQQSQTSKKQGVKDVIDDCGLLSNPSIFEAVPGLHRLTTKKKSTLLFFVIS